MAMKPIQGIHHITAVASDPQRNVDFYHAVLGQRLVKTTVNFDDPSTYHLYYGDEIGSPGTIMTFFPWQGMRKGRPGNGEVGATAYSIPTAALAYWRERLAAHNVAIKAEEERFGDTVLVFNDPDGMVLELVATDDPTTIQHWQDGPVPPEYAIRGFHSVTLFVNRHEYTERVLVDQLGYTAAEQADNRYRYKGASEDIGLYVDLLERPGLGRGAFGAGSVHHLAFRTVDDSEQAEYLEKLRGAGLNVSPVRDRQYFHSIYFREPNGVLFEVATDAPGFLYDEPLEQLGTNLKLPDWYEPRRAEIAASVTPFTIPTFDKETTDNE